VTTTDGTGRRAGRRSGGTRAGYVVAIVINVALLVAVNNLLAWDVLPFLTDQFTRVLPLVNLSLSATIAANVIYLGYDEKWFSSLSQVVLLGISMAATVRIYRVFPFDFSGYWFAWATVTRAVLILAMVGVTIAIVVETVRLTAALARR
jgi:hypothetical protein